MSGAKGMRVSTRDPHERYYTPDHVALAHVRYVAACSRAGCVQWVDPCAGEGAYGRAFAAAHGEGLLPSATWAGCDLHPGADVPVGDLRDPHWYRDGAIVLTNPPFSLVPDLLAAAHGRASIVSLLLPVSALEATRARRRWLVDHPPGRVAFIGRVRFTGPAAKAGGASMQYCFATWFRDRRDTLTEWLSLSRLSL